MENNKPSYYHGKKPYKTVLLLICNLAFKLVLLSLVAWFLLALWFMSQSIFQGAELAQYKMDSISHYYAQAIMGKSIFIDKVMACCSDFKEHFFTFLKSVNESLSHLLRQFNFQSNFSNLVTKVRWLFILVDATEIVISRILLFTMSLPFFLGVLFVFTVDGLAQRDIRKYQGARESTFFFHRIKPVAGKLYFICYLAYLSLPISFHPMLLLVPMSVASSLLASLSIQNYKKYV